MALLVENAMPALERKDSAPAPGSLSSEGVVKRTAKAAILGTYKHSGLMRLQESVRWRTSTPYTTILLFHRVTDQIPPDGLTVGTRWFRDFCRLMKSNYNVVSLTEIDRLMKSGERPKRRTVAITFDDCYADNLPAAKVLHEHGLPATFFVPTQFVGTDHRFFWDSHLPQLPNLSWDDLRQMAAWGHEIGSHSVSHPDFGTLNDAEALREMVDSRRELQRKLNREIDWFAFPFGDGRHYRPHQARLAAEAGYKGTFSAVAGFIEGDMTGQILPRQAVTYFHNLTQLELHINRSLDWVYRLKRTMGLL